ncbi:MAG: glycoside hydrolase family 43 protein [Ferruginibacter sp.]
MLFAGIIILNDFNAPAAYFASEEYIQIIEILKRMRHIKNIAIISLLLTAVLLNINCSPQKAASKSAGKLPGSISSGIHNKSFKPGERWFDDKGEIINAHGGGILFSDNKYYWFGEKRGRREQEGVNVYSSNDLYNWKFEALALSPGEDTTSDIARGCLMERPKVIYNSHTKKYVMWFHLELRKQGYKAARAAVAQSDNITGPYKYISGFRPNGNMSRDMNLFVDDDGTAYHIYSSRENYDLRISKLTEDFLFPTTEDTMLFSKHREAPALFKYKDQYYLITSAATGWAPNKATLHVAPTLFGPWKLSEENPMVGANADSTFGGQSTYVFPVPGKKNAFIFIADKWNPKDLKDSRYLWLPIQFKNDLPFIKWKDQWSLNDFETGK